MRKGRQEVERGYPPDYVSAETLAYRLDCEVDAVEGLMRKGALPRPHMIGGLRRWDFASERAFVQAQNAPAKRLAPNGQPGPEDDAFLAALTNGRADKRAQHLKVLVEEAVGNSVSPDFTFLGGDTKGRMLALARVAGLDAAQLARLEARLGVTRV